LGGWGGGGFRPGPLGGTHKREHPHSGNIYGNLKVMTVPQPLSSAKKTQRWGSFRGWGTANSSDDESEGDGGGTALERRESWPTKLKR